MARRTHWIAVLVLGALALGTIVAFAAGDDRSAAESAIADLEKDPKTKALTADAVKQARAALERARRMRDAGDDRHAHLAEGLALEWARVGQTLVRATEAEDKAKVARQAALDAGARVDRERAMVEQQLAENGRLQGELASLQGSKDGGASKPASGPRDAGKGTR
jgi:hypothetical protein